MKTTHRGIPVCTATTTAKAAFVMLTEGAGLDDNVRSSQARWFRQFQNCSLHKCGSGEPVSTDVRAVEDLGVS